MSEVRGDIRTWAFVGFRAGPLQRRAGFSLAEVVVAIGVVGVGIVAVLGAVATLLRLPRLLKA